MDSQLLLIKAIRSGRLSDVCSVLDEGASAETNSGLIDSSLPMGFACFMGFIDIVRELVRRGACVDFEDNSLPTSPLSMALRGGRMDVIRCLIELGVSVPPGMNLDLSDPALISAHGNSAHDSHAVAPPGHGTDGNNL